MKQCKECKCQLTEDQFNSKGGDRKNTICKVCEYTKKKKYTCEIPPDKKQCTCCKELKYKNNFRDNTSKCYPCIQKIKELTAHPKGVRTEKECKECHLILPVEDFYTKGMPSGKIGYHYKCKKCSNIIRYKRKVSHPTQRSFVVKEMRSLQLNLDRQKNRAKNYGMTLEQLNEMISKQNNKCYICGLPGEENVHGVLCIDHCHSSLKVRKLLCNSCNVALGQLKDDMSYIRKLVDYLKLHK